LRFLRSLRDTSILCDAVLRVKFLQAAKIL
jgi:hypothetical protein